ncbi:MAG: Allergen V5/Tpx related-like protein [Frankiales bacterium]|nr:Allergen V5/Tpx related-like protein [Frankiales bacterium]
MKRLALLLTTVSLSAFLVPATPASAETYPEAVLRYTNYERGKAGVSPLKLSFCMRDQFAGPWAKHLAATRTLVHQSLTPMMSRCHGNAAAENIASGNWTPQQMVNAWMNSQGHRKNLLNPSYNYIGIGAVRGSDGHVYGVQDFLHQ